ncbi:3269_t:CDS:2, partial [Dentiscutata heterogama]
MECFGGTDDPEYCDKNRIRAEKNEPEAHMSRPKIPLHESDDEVKSLTKSESNGIGVGKGKPTDSCEILDVISIEWKKKIESFKTRFSVIKRDESPVKRKKSAVDEAYENDQEVVGACKVWKLKVENIRGVKSDPPSLKKHDGEVGDNIRMVKCKDIGNSPSFSNNKVNVKVKRVQMKVRVELWRTLTMKKLHGLIIETRSADKDRIGSLVERPFMKNNIGD